MSSVLKIIVVKGGSHGLVVMRGGSHTKGCGFESQHRTGWKWNFFTLICCKNCFDVCLKRPKINEKEAGVGPFLKNHHHCCCSDVSNHSFWDKILDRFRMFLLVFRNLGLSRPLFHLFATFVLSKNTPF